MRNRRTRFMTAAIGVATVLSLATACADSDSSNKGKPASKPTAKTQQKDDNTEAAPTPNASETKTATGPTIKLGWCTNGSDSIRAVQSLDPETKDGATSYFPLEPLVYRSAADCDSNLPGSKARSAFNAPFTKLGGQWKYNGTYRVGYSLPAADPSNTVTTFEDLSGITEGSDGGNFGTTPEQSKGFFGTDGKIYFVEDTGNSITLKAVDPDSKQIVKRPNPGDISYVDPTDSTQYQFFLPSDDTVYTDDRVQSITNKDRTWSIWAGDGTISYGKPGSKGTTTEATPGKTLYPVAIDPTDNMKFIGWDNDKQIVRATIKGNTVTTQNVLEDTKGEISEVTVDPTGTKAAFILQTRATSSGTGGYGSSELYTVSLEGTGTNTPTLIKKLKTDTDTIPADTFRIYAWN